MATVNQTQNGRRITLCNLSNKTLGVCGTLIRPGKTSTVKLAKIQKSKLYMDELHEHVSNGMLHVLLEGCSLPAHFVDQTEIKSLDAALEAKIATALDLWTAPVTADTDGYKTVILAPAANTTYLGSDFNGAIGQGSVDFARNVTVTGICAGGETLAEKSVVLVGYDIEGVLRSETLTVSTGGQVGVNTTTYSGVVAFKRLYSAYFPLDAGGAGRGDYTIGFGDVLGLGRPLTQGGPLAEFVNNAGPGVPGTWVVSGTSGPNGTYTPNQAPNGARNYLLVYVPN